MRFRRTEPVTSQSRSRRAQAVCARRVAFGLLLMAACSEAPTARPHKAVEAEQPSAPQPPAAGLPEGVQPVRASAVLERARKPGTRGLVVNAWASWCGSCREEIPMLLALRKAFGPEGIELVFVSMDEPQDYAKAVELMRSLAGPLPTLAVAKGTRAEFKRAMSPNWRGGMPATFLFDATGKLRHLWEGPILEHEISPVLQGFLAGDAIDGETRTAAEPN
jgi:thiol-disulfide isomerase/thioredoxin